MAVSTPPPPVARISASPAKDRKGHSKKLGTARQADIDTRKKFDLGDDDVHVGASLARCGTLDCACERIVHAHESACPDWCKI